MSTPFLIFKQWFQDAEKAQVIEPNAMVLSTVNEQNHPTSRVVLLKRWHDEVMYFFTNYTSDKSKQMEKNPFVSVNLHWRQPLHRQIRVDGKVIKATKEISDEYFSTRARGSQIGAWASPQSQTITNREELEKRVAEIEKKFAGRDVPRPEFWGGWGLIPSRFEFWQEGDSRLHTRTVYEKQGSEWKTRLLGP